MLKLIRLFVVIGVLCFSYADAVAMQETKDVVGNEVVNQERSLQKVDDLGPSTVELVGRIVVYLLLLAAIGAVILHFFRQGRFIKGVKSKGKLLKVTETHMLGNKQFLVVVEYESRKVLLGVGPGMINKLCFLDGPKRNMVVNKDREVKKDSF